MSLFRKAYSYLGVEYTITITTDPTDNPAARNSFVSVHINGASSDPEVVMEPLSQKTLASDLDDIHYLVQRKIEQQYFTGVITPMEHTLANMGFAPFTYES